VRYNVQVIEVSSEVPPGYSVCDWIEVKDMPRRKGEVMRYTGSLGGIVFEEPVEEATLTRTPRFYEDGSIDIEICGEMVCRAVPYTTASFRLTPMEA
jgi:hypothetical protein